MVRIAWSSLKEPWLDKNQWGQTRLESIINGINCAAIEVVNGRNNDLEDSLALDLARKTGLPCVAGSDAHSFDELGRFPTRFGAEIKSSADLVRALKEGRCEPGAIDVIRAAS